MSLAGLLGVAAALAVVLALLALVFRVLRWYAGFGGGPGRGFPLEVVARLGLGPRQGLAVVRVGERMVIVSVGEGGVRPVLELGEAECAALRREVAGEGAVAPWSLGGRLRGLLRVLVLGAALAGAGVVFGAADAWAAEAAPASLAQVSGGVAGAAGVPAASLLPRLSLTVGGGADGELRLSGTVGMVLVLGLLATLPTLLLLMTGFTRILVVLHLLRQAIGTQTAPPAHLLAALALILTGFVMAPTLAEVNRTALRPWVEGRIDEAAMLRAAVVPFREFMLRQTSEEDIAKLVEIAGVEPPAAVEEVPTVTLVSAFAMSELRRAFQIGFVIFLPFVVIDLVVAAVLTSMGMFMLPPAMISLPCKLILFVLVDGWALVVEGLVSSFR
jgi:flagellar biosynthetic protein FliP